MASPRRLAASMAMERFSLRLAWPVKSANRWDAGQIRTGARLRAAKPMRFRFRRMLSHQLQRLAEQRLESRGRLGSFGFAYGGFGGNALAA